MAKEIKPIINLKVFTYMILNIYCIFLPQKNITAAFPI